MDGTLWSMTGPFLLGAAAAYWTVAVYILFGKHRLLSEQHIQMIRDCERAKVSFEKLAESSNALARSIKHGL
jgi:hypothetical protein